MVLLQRPFPLREKVPEPDVGGNDRATKSRDTICALCTTVCESLSLGEQVGTSTLGLQVMHVGIHTMVRSTVPIFVLLFSVGIGLQVTPPSVKRFGSRNESFCLGLLKKTLAIVGNSILTRRRHTTFPIKCISIRFVELAQQ